MGGGGWAVVGEEVEAEFLGGEVNLFNEAEAEEGVEFDCGG